MPPKAGWEADALARTLGVYYRVDRASVVDIQAAIVNIGAVYVSAQVHDGWDEVTFDRNTRAPRKHADIPDIPLVRSRLSGHSFALVGYDAKGFIVQNSWGRRFGAAGFARMSYNDWAKHGTDALACAIGVPGALPEPWIRLPWIRLPWIRLPPGFAIHRSARRAASSSKRVEAGGAGFPGSEWRKLPARPVARSGALPRSAWK